MHNVRPDFVTIFIILLLINLVAILVLYRTNRKLTSARQDLVSSWQEQNEYMDRNVEFCRQAEEISRQISSFVEQRSAAAAGNDCMERCTELMQYMHGGTNIEEALIAEKKAACSRKGIEFIDEIGALPNGRMRETDTVSLFGNLIDNAIEACESSRDERPFVKVNTQTKRNGLIIHIANSKDPGLDLHDTGMKTTKEDTASHGLGLEIVRRIVSEYNGNIKMNDRGQTFETDLIVFMKKDPGSARKLSRSKTRQKHP